MAPYAAGTVVDVGKSKIEVERILTRYGATTFIYGWEADRCVIGFRMADRHVKMIFPMPKLADFRTTPTGRQRGPSASVEAQTQAVRERWRAITLVIKAKLEAVACGVSIFDDEFMPHIVMPDGSTVGEHARPQITAAYKDGKMPKLMLSYGGKQ